MFINHIKTFDNRLLFTAGLLFAGKMREQGYVTMLDPFNKHYGRVTTAILCLPASVADLFFTAAILAALGTIMKIRAFS